MECGFSDYIICFQSSIQVVPLALENRHGPSAFQPQPDWEEHSTLPLPYLQNHLDLCDQSDCSSRGGNMPFILVASAPSVASNPKQEFRYLSIRAKLWQVIWIRSYFF